MRTSLTFTEEEVQALAGFGSPIDDLCSGMGSGEGSDGATMTQETDGNEVRCVGRKGFASLDELDSGDSFAINSAQIADGNFVFDADVSGPSGGDSPFDLSSLDLEQLFGGFSYRLTAPGVIDRAASNADAYEGSTAIWNLKIGEARQLRVESSGF